MSFGGKYFFFIRRVLPEVRAQEQRGLASQSGFLKIDLNLKLGTTWPDLSTKLRSECVPWIFF